MSVTKKIMPTYDQYLARGNQLLDYFDTPTTELTAKLLAGRRYQQETFTDEDPDIQLRANGWSSYTQCPDRRIENGIEQAIRSIPSILSTPFNAHGVPLSTDHEEPYGLNEDETDEEWYITEAEFHAVYITEQWEDKLEDLWRRDDEPDAPELPPLPDLRHRADVVFVTYQAECARQPGTFVRDLRHIFHAAVSNAGTKSVMGQALGTRGLLSLADLRKTNWHRRVSFEGRSKEGKALLASPTGLGVAWMLLRYREHLG
jgi:hypothetical protein